MAEDDIQFVEPQYGAKDQKSFPGIVLEQLERVLRLSCVEFFGGHWNKKGTKQGFIEEIYVQDSLEAWHNSVYALYSTIFPYFDKKALDIIKPIIGQIDKLENVSKEIKKEDYRKKKEELTWQLFQQLSWWLKELNYFKPRSIIAGLEALESA